MKIIILASKLKEGISSFDRIVAEDKNLPVLKNILITAEKNKIKLAATNLEIGVTRYVSGKVLEDGGITIPFSVFFSSITNTTSERINLETKGTTLILKTDNYEAIIQGIPTEEFPIIPTIIKNQSIIIPNTTLKEALVKILPAAHPSELRPEIGGVLFDYQTSILKLVATDTFRLAQVVLPHQQFTTTHHAGFSAIIPLKTIQEVIRIFPESQTISIFFDENQALFKTDDAELISRLIDGEYPDYEAIIPTSSSTTITVEREHLMGALKLVGGFSSKTNEVDIQLREGKKTISLHSSHQYIGENTYLIPIKLEGEDLPPITFNWRYLYDGLKPASGEMVILGITNNTKPAVIKNPTDTSYLYILMPVKA